MDPGMKLAARHFHLLIFSVLRCSDVIIVSWKRVGIRVLISCVYAHTYQSDGLMTIFQVIARFGFFIHFSLHPLGTDKNYHFTMFS